MPLERFRRALLLVVIVTVLSVCVPSSAAESLPEEVRTSVSSCVEELEAAESEVQARMADLARARLEVARMYLDYIQQSSESSREHPEVKALRDRCVALEKRCSELPDPRSASVGLARTDAFRDLVRKLEARFKCHAQYWESPAKGAKTVILCPEEHSDQSDARQAERLAALDEACGLDCVLVEGLMNNTADLRRFHERFTLVLDIGQPFDPEFGEPGVSTFEEAQDEENARRRVLRGDRSFALVGLETVDTALVGNLYLGLTEILPDLIHLWEEGAFEGGKGLPGDPKGPAGGMVQWDKVTRELVRLCPAATRSTYESMVPDFAGLKSARQAGHSADSVFLMPTMDMGRYKTTILLQHRNREWLRAPHVRKALGKEDFRRLALVCGTAHADLQQEDGALTDLRVNLKDLNVSWIRLPEVK